MMHREPSFDASCDRSPSSSRSASSFSWDVPRVLEGDITLTTLNHRHDLDRHAAAGQAKMAVTEAIELVNDPAYAALTGALFPGTPQKSACQPGCFVHELES